jgi:Protein of unknown function (DUF2934)
MKTKGKKADKKKTLVSKQDTKQDAKRVADVLKTTDPAPRIDVRAPAPIEVFPEVMAKEVLPKEKTRAVMTAEERQRLISLAAYYRAERKGFGKTNPVEDWLLAEREIDAMITREVSI